MENFIFCAVLHCLGVFFVVDFFIFEHVRLYIFVIYLLFAEDL